MLLKSKVYFCITQNACYPNKLIVISSIIIMNKKFNIDNYIIN
jgi:hypothetical protein